MLQRIRTSTLSGLSALPVEVEVEVRQGKVGFSIIGLADAAVREARDRVLSALRLSGYTAGPRVLVNLAPAEVKKEGASFDLAIALGILLASGQVRGKGVDKRIFHGELSLDGRVRPIRGAAALAVEALHSGAEEIVVPAENQAEAALVKSIKVVGVESLAQLAAYLEGRYVPAPHSINNNDKEEAANRTEMRLSDVQGQTVAKRGCIIAAAGGHNLLMLGPPGCGKSMLASRFPSILPPLSQQEMLEVVKIHSIAGMDIKPALRGKRPFRAPHHGISEAGLIGGNTSPRPGEISLAHKGVLFLDEFPEFKRGILEALRAPLESGKVTISRAKGSVTFPADFQLIAAMNPCPCGKLGAPNLQCVCSIMEQNLYWKRISEPIMDRIDLWVEMDAVPISILHQGIVNAPEEQLLKDDEIIQQINIAQELSKKRQGKLNASLDNNQLRKKMNSSKNALKLLEQTAKAGKLSARGYFRMLKVARTIADLAESEKLEEEHISEALRFRPSRGG